MSRRRADPRLTAAAALIAAALCAAAPAPREFSAIWREKGAAWLLAADGGGIWLQRGGAAPSEALRFTSGGRPYRWRFAPRGLVRWRGEWLVIDGSERMARFDERGRLTGDRLLPTHASAITRSDRTLWLYDFLPSDAGPRFWKSDDGIAFVPVLVDDVTAGGGGSRAARALAAQLVVSAGPGDELYFSHLVGAPEIRRVRPGASIDVVSVAYSRSRRRAALESFADGQFDPKAYSSPVADILPLPTGELLVLRNREDVRRTGGTVTEVGRRIDRYSSDGAHIATAVLAESGRWILGPDAVLSPSGNVVRAVFQKPLRGEILP
jgi:hypothetical protein